MKKHLKIILKWILYIFIPLLLFNIIFCILYTSVGELPIQLMHILKYPQQELIFTTLEDAFMFKVSFVTHLSIFFTVLFISIYILLRSSITIAKNVTFNLVASIVGLLIGYTILYFKTGNKPIENLETFHPELVPIFGSLSIALMTTIMIILSKRATLCKGRRKSRTAPDKQRCA